MAYYQTPSYHQAPYTATALPPMQHMVPPQHSVDPFRAHYAHRLRELTFNSRPIIQELSMMAMQQRDVGDWTRMRGVVEELEAAVLRAAPPYKLPLLYLIDSISKNAGQPYTDQLLPGIIPRLYVKTYREVDGVTKSKMEEMIALWRTGGPGGVELYGPAVREQVEREIFGSVGAAYMPVGAPTKERVMATLRTTLEAKHRDSVMRPWDGEVRHQIDVLGKISNILNASQLPPTELQKIMDQLKGMTARSQAPPPPQHLPPPQQSPYPPMNGGGMPNFPPRPVQMAAPSPNLPPFPPSFGNTAYRSNVPTPQSAHTPIPGSSTPLAPVSSYGNQPPQAPTPVPSAPLPFDVANILRNLNTTGILSNPGTPPAQQPSTLSSDSRRQAAMDEYEEMILRIDNKLESLNLNIMSQLPLDHLPKKCTQCGKRFPEDDGGKLTVHMDWHFRRNRKEKESGGRGAHRRWLPKAEEWINDVAVAEASPSTTTAATVAPVTALPEKLAALRKKSVKVPSDSNVVCPICKEPFVKELDQENEEWVWRNALAIETKYYHATCRYEQQLARKLLNASGNGKASSKSPGLTPQPENAGSPLKIETIKTEEADAANGNKRKAEEQQAAEREEMAKRVKVEEGVTPAAPQEQTEVPRENEAHVKLEPGLEMDEMQDTSEPQSTQLEQQSIATEDAPTIDAPPSHPTGQSDQSPAAAQEALDQTMSTDAPEADEGLPQAVVETTQGDIAVDA